jgi:DNA helicase II / ATP-dependent DNA helicase PcrA
LTPSRGTAKPGPAVHELDVSELFAVLLISMSPEFKPTDEQKAILAHKVGRHARVLAGPGTGKSATVVALLNQLLSPDDPPRVRLLTFTRAASGELAQKVAEHPAAATQRPSTIHSFAISVLLRNEGAAEFPEPLRIADDWETEKIIHPTLGRRTSINVRRLDRLFRELAANWERLEPLEDAKIDPEERRRFLGAWGEHRDIFGYTLLAELPNALREALMRHPDLKGLDYDLIVVDEYQDLNACDLELLHRIADRGVSLIGCGDDNQSIYSFRYASPEGIRRYPDDYPACNDYSLSITHRCGSRILAWANYVIDGSVDPRRTKTKQKPAPGSPDGEVALLRFGSELAEAKGVAFLVQSLIQKDKVTPKKILILVRSDHQGRFSRPIQEALRKVNIVYSDSTALKRIFGEPSNRKLIALLRLLTNETDSLAWATLLKLERGISDQFLDALYEEARKRRIRFGEALQRAATAAIVVEPKVSAQRASRLFREVRDLLAKITVPEETPEGGWGGWIILAASEGLLPLPSDELTLLLLKVDELTEAKALDRYLGQLFPLAKDVMLAESEGVRIMTMMGSKGLTVDATILVGAEEGLVPRPDFELEEERRLLYVAMTRSKRFLFLTWAATRRGPTARSGRGRPGRQNHSSFLNGGPVQSQDGTRYIQARGRL